MTRSAAAMLLLCGCLARPTQPLEVPETGSAPVLLDAATMKLVAVSPDEQRVLVSREQGSASDLEIVTIGQPTATLAEGAPGVTGRFAADGRALVFVQPALGGAEAVHVARADGSGARLLTAQSTFHALAGRWLYSEDESTPVIGFYRLLPPDGAPQLLASFAPPHAAGPFSALPSPDGESVAFCHSPASGENDCFLFSAGATTPLPGAPQLWSPDGRWLLTATCALVELSGRARQVCDPAVEAVRAVSQDGETLAIFAQGHSWPPGPSSVQIRLHAVSTGADVVLPSPQFDGAVYRPAFDLRLTPDGSRLVAFLGSAVFSAPAAGGSWTEIASDGPPLPHRGAVFVSPDSRIVAVPSESQGMVESIDGKPASSVGAFFGVAFEPPGGLDKALFISENQDSAVLANADGSGASMRLPRIGECGWVGRAALCLRWASGQPNQLVVITDEGRSLSVVSHDTSEWPTTGKLTARTLFYIGHEGGLYALNYRAP